MEDTIFWNVDTQKDFMLPDGKLYIPGAETIIPALKNVTDWARDTNIRVINTGDYHSVLDEEISEKPDFKTTFPPHCMMGTEGMRFIDETKPELKNGSYYLLSNQDSVLDESKLLRARNIILLKNKFDIFEGNKWTKEVLECLKPKNIIIYGVAAEICVNFAVIGLQKLGYNIYIFGNGIWGLDRKKVKELKNDWFALERVFFTTVEDMI